MTSDYWDVVQKDNNGGDVHCMSDFMATAHCEQMAGCIELTVLPRGPVIRCAYII